MSRRGVAQLAERRSDEPEVASKRFESRLPDFVRRHKPVTWGQLLGRPECPYARRWIFGFGLGSVRVHHFYRSDDERHFHDHPWWFVTLVLRGGYTDVSPAGEDRLRPGSVRFRPALHRHTVRADPGGVWTVVVTGRPLRVWGFWVGERFKRSRRYFFDHGHHPCDQP